MFMKNIKWIGVVLLAQLFVGCGGASKETDKMVTYIHLSPTDTQVLTTDQPTFKFERNINNTSSALPCTTNSGTLHDVQVKVIKIDTQTDNAIVVVDEVVHVPNECQFEVQFPSLTLEENVGYAWRVGEPDEVETTQTTWNSFLYSTVSMGSEDSDTKVCENNMVDDWSFTEAKSPWRTSNIPQFTQNIPALIATHGDEDNGSGIVQTPNELIFQVLSQPIEQGKYYQLKFSIKHEGKTDFQIKALAFNGMLDNLQADANTSVIAQTGLMTYTGNWVKVTLAPWKANKNFTSLAIAVLNDNNSTMDARIDKVCLVESNNSGCGESVDFSTSFPDGFDVNNSNPIETEFEYLSGTVMDLYPDANMSSSDWFLEENGSSLECTTMGETEYTDDEEIEFANQDANNTAIEEAQNEMDDWIADHNDSSLYDSNDTNLTPIASPSHDCTQRIVDYSKPFSGRDIVYVHGLQKDAIDDLTRSIANTKYHGRWPHDPTEFIQGGAYYTEAEQYWNDHITQELGSVNNPSNSYLIVTWSALQRAHIGINAILHQIRDARDGNNPSVHFSKSSLSNNQCFGDNGIVFVSHSTGGMLVSMMFGEMEIYKNNPGYENYVDPQLQNLFDAQIGFDAAYGRSGVATAGLMTTHVTHRPAEAYSSVLVDLGVPAVSNQNRDIMEHSQKPTLMMIGTLAGPPAHIGGSQTAGSIFLKGYNDGVLASWVQSAHKRIRPKYFIRPAKLRRLYDKGAAPSKAVGMVRQGRSLIPLTRRYYVSPAFAPSGMLQDSVFYYYLHQRKYIHNHFPVIQTTGDHFDNVNKILRNGRDYYQPLGSLGNNDEETSVTYQADTLYDNGYISHDFKNLQEEWIKKKTWGFNFFKVTWVSKEIKLFGRKIHIKVPKLTWHYYEFIKWKRTYHLLHDYKYKRGADYMYQYLLRP